MRRLCSLFVVLIFCTVFITIHDSEKRGEVHCLFCNLDGKILLISLPLHL